MGTMYTYSFSNKVRDFEAVLRVLQERKARITSLFSPWTPVDDRTFYWHDYISQPVSAQINNGGGYPSGTSTFTVDTEVGEFQAGDTITFKDSNYETLIVNTWVSGTLTTTTNSTAAHADDVVILRISTPRAESTSKSAEDIDEGTKRTNYTEIFRRDITISGSALEGKDEDFIGSRVDRGVSQKFMEIYEDLARVLIYGSPVAPSGSVKGRTAGLLYWLNQAGALKYDKSGATLTADHINAAIEAVFNKGGDPNVIVCDSASARKISAMNTSTTNQVVYINAQDADLARGANQASKWSGDLTGTGLKAVLVEPNMPSSVMMLLTSEDLKLCPKGSRSFKDWDSTDADLDGVSRSILGEYGTKIFNPYTAHALVYNYA